MAFDIFSEIKKLAEVYWPEPITTNQLGRVRIIKNEYNEWVGEIPKSLANEARKYGLEISKADFTSDEYWFRLVAK